MSASIVVGYTPLGNVRAKAWVPFLQFRNRPSLLTITPSDSPRTSGQQFTYPPGRLVHGSQHGIGDFFFVVLFVRHFIFY